MKISSKLFRIITTFFVALKTYAVSFKYIFEQKLPDFLTKVIEEMCRTPAESEMKLLTNLTPVAASN